MPVPNVKGADFGPLVLNTDVDEWLIQILSTWLPDYMSQVERERGMEHKYLDRPHEESYANVLDDDEFPDYRMPAVLVTTANTQNSEKDGDGFYTAAFNVVVSAIVRGRTPAETRQRAALFEGCVRRVMVQADPLWDGEVHFVGSNVAAVADPTGAGRYLAAGIGNYLVYVDKVVQAGVGPAGEPYAQPGDPDYDPDTPYEDLITVGSVSTDVTGKSPTDDLGE